MTVETDDTIERYTISGVGPYAFSFRIFAETDLAVTACSTATPPIPQPLTYLTHYTVAGANDADGGTVSLTSGVATTYAGYTLDIRSNTPEEQNTSIRNLGRFLPEIHEDAFDNLSRQIQDLSRRVSASVHIPDDEILSGEVEAAEVRKGKYLFWDSVTGAISSALSLTGTVLTQLIFNAYYALTEDHKRTAAEIAALVVPVDYSFLPGHRSRYSTLADAVAVCAAHPLCLYSDETITAAITIPDGGKIYGIGQPLITQSTAGVHVFDATSKSNIVIDGVRFKGANSSTTPSTGFGGFSAANNGLVTISNSTDIRITNCSFDTFYNGVTTQGCDRVWVMFNRCRHFRFAGILGSLSTYGSFDYNAITECDQTGAAVAYGIIVTGDELAAKPQTFCSISFNMINGIPSWAGIMSHDCDGMRIIGNDIRDVRKGIDIGFLVNTNEMRNLIVSGNYMKSTATDTWGGAGADHGGIQALGYDATNRLLGCAITGNIIDGFFSAAGLVPGGIPSHIVVAYADDVTVSGNVVKNGGTLVSSAGIYMTGTVNRVAITGNSLQGTMAKGGIRCETVTADVMTIADNTVVQTTASDNAVAFTGSTISQLRVDIGATNSTAPFSQGTSTLTFSGDYLEGSATYDPPSLADGAGTTTTVTVTGAALGDHCVVSFGGDLSGISVTSYVSAADTVSVRLQNESGGVLDLGSSTLRARVFRRH